MQHSPAGIYPMLYAYYDPAGELDREAMRRQIDCCVAAGAHGIAVLGLITEVADLTVSERRQIVDWAVEDIEGRVPLAVTVAGETAADQTAFARAYVAAGADWLILQPPKQSKPGEAELQRFFGATMRSVDVPVGIQNFPEVLGVGLGAAAIGELRRVETNFTVMKGEGPVYQIRQYLDACAGAIAIFNGRGGIELPDNLRAGCRGIIPAPDCADVQVAMYDAFVANDMDRVDALYTRSLPYVTFVMQSVEFALTYGKRFTAERMSIGNAALPRVIKISADDFGLERLYAHGAFAKGFGEWVE